jgi:hypothetical protein
MRRVKTPAHAALVLLLGLVACSRDAAPGASGTAAAGAGTHAGAASAVAAQPEILPPGKRRVLELEGGVRVEVLAEGTGAEVGPGDEVALGLTLSYVPQPAPAGGASTTAEDAPSATAPEHGAESPDAQSAPTPGANAEPTGAGPALAASEPVAAASAPPGPEAQDEGAAPTVPPTAPVAEPEVPPTAQPSAADAAVEAAAVPAGEPAADSGAAADGAGAATAADPDDVAAADPLGETAAGSSAAHEDAPGTAPAPAALDAPLAPVILVSTKESGVPIRARVGADGALLPGLSRALLGLRAGTIAEITLPAESAYGADGLASAGIPPATPLLARVEIREVRR